MFDQSPGRNLARPRSPWPGVPPSFPFRSTNRSHLPPPSLPVGPARPTAPLPRSPPTPISLPFLSLSRPSPPSPELPRSPSPPCRPPIPYKSRNPGPLPVPFHLAVALPKLRHPLPNLAGVGLKPKLPRAPLLTPSPLSPHRRRQPTEELPHCVPDLSAVAGGHQSRVPDHPPPRPRRISRRRNATPCEPPVLSP